ncbi:hypothetical protein [Anaerotignum sp. MB30-C6]|uniref:hypothetical protein n=1 Tax=Anaerotignum sp. MB30-C6 TaxID=3070814 RepID=UPI0027DE2B14|nr:hypothetical protein [Anaerotignum sp. MB30-C6]WMI81091.1 hypothetical protein RBQ60_14975 [Anaerotignum sp. MB30-C6]
MTKNYKLRCTLSLIAGLIWVIVAGLNFSNKNIAFGSIALAWVFIYLTMLHYKARAMNHSKNKHL